MKHVFFIRSLRSSKKIHIYNNRSNESRNSSVRSCFLWLTNIQNISSAVKSMMRKFNSFLKSLNWEDPWHSNSQVSHQIMIISIKKSIKKNKNYDELIKKILTFFDSIY